MGGGSLDRNSQQLGTGGDVRVLVLGASGMLGHKLAQRLAPRFDVAAALRTVLPGSPTSHALANVRVVEASADIASVEAVLDAFTPDVILNAIGIVKQLKAAHDPIASITVNALLPHRLAALTASRHARLIHFSTDCVFSGRAGPYSESSEPDPLDLYGRSKLLGEVTGDNCLTIRSSIIGHGITPGPGLVDWVVGSAGGEVNGYDRALYTGLSTLAMADLVGDIVDHHRELAGLWQVSSEPITKRELISLVNDTYRLGLTIRPDTTVSIDRRLDSSAFRAATGWRPQPWPAMIAEMQTDWLASRVADS